MFWQIISIPSDIGSFFVRAPGLEQYSVLFWLFAFAGLIIAITIHEFAHAWSANILGDNTAKLNNRMNVNPINHFDTLGFLLILFAPIGYGRPVPVNPNNFRNPVQGTMFVSLAGPVSNIIQAVIAGALFIALKQIPFQEGWISTLTISLSYIGFINIALAFFNLLPIHPLDGSKIWGYLHPRIDDFIINYINPYGIIIIILLIVPIFGFSIFQLLLSPVSAVYYSILNI